MGATGTVPSNSSTELNQNWTAWADLSQFLQNEMRDEDTTWGCCSISTCHRMPLPQDGSPATWCLDCQQGELPRGHGNTSKSQRQLSALLLLLKKITSRAGSVIVYLSVKTQVSIYMVLLTEAWEEGRAKQIPELIPSPARTSHWHLHDEKEPESWWFPGVMVP